jgi:uncharacterized protein YoxC
VHHLIIILYLSVAFIAIAFFILVIYISKMMNSVRISLESVTRTLGGLEKQIEGVTTETTELLKKTNYLAEDLQRKSESLNGVVDAVKDIGTTISHFNQTLQSITNVVDRQVEGNKEKISQVIQWSNVILELKDKWKSKKQEKALNTKREIIIKEKQKDPE